MELTVRPAEGNTLLTSPHVSREVRVVSLHIWPGGSLRQLHLGGARLNVQGSCKLTASCRSLQLLIGRSRLLVIVLLGILSVGKVRIPVTVRAVQIQVLPCKQGTAALGRLAHDRCEQLALLAVAVISPDFNHVLLRSIQGVCRKMHVTVQVAVTVCRVHGGVVKLDNVAGCQNRGVRALLTNHELNALNGVDIAVEALSANVQILRFCGISHTVVTQTRCERLCPLAQSVQNLGAHHVLAGPQLLSGQRFLTLLLSNHVNLVADIVLGAAGRILGVIVINEVVGGKLVRLNLQVSLKSAVIGNGEVLTLHKAQHLRSRNLVAGGCVVRGSNVQRYGAVLGAPLLRVARALHVDGTALGRYEEDVYAVVVVTIGERHIQGRGIGSDLVGRLRGGGNNGGISGRSRILSQRRGHRQNHRASQRQRAATLSCAEERRLRVRKRGHNTSLKLFLAGICGFNGG